jgi:hypothetical protein
MVRQGQAEDVGDGIVGVVEERERKQCSKDLDCFHRAVNVLP